MRPSYGCKPRKLDAWTQVHMRPSEQVKTRGHIESDESDSIEIECAPRLLAMPASCPGVKRVRSEKGVRAKAPQCVKLREVSCEAKIFQRSWA